MSLPRKSDVSKHLARKKKRFPALQVDAKHAPATSDKSDVSSASQLPAQRGHQPQI